MVEYGTLVEENILSMAGGVTLGAAHYILDSICRLDDNYDGFLDQSDSRVAGAIGLPLGGDVWYYGSGALDGTVLFEGGVTDDPGIAAGYLAATTGLYKMESVLWGKELDTERDVDQEELYDQVKE